MARRGHRPETGPDDQVLAERAAQGDEEAFDQLYRRHSPAAWRVAHAVTGNPHDSSDAVAEAFSRVLVVLEAGKLDDSARFRSYLLSATRNAALDVARRTGRSRPTATPETFESPSQVVGPSDGLVDRVDASLVAAAFRSLPERWRSVLWLTEVEGIPPREAALLLGVSANGVAQLAVRARAGLRERFLQAHLRGEVEDACRFTVDHLGAYVGGGLAPRDAAKVDQHLAGCVGCGAREQELEDLAPSLRRVALPLPLGLAGVAAARWKGALASAHAARAAHAAHVRAAAARAAARHRRSRWVGGMVQAHRPLLTMSLGLLAMSIIAATIVGQQGQLQVPGRLAGPSPAGAAGDLSISVNPAAAPLVEAAALAQAATPAVAVAGAVTGPAAPVGAAGAAAEPTLAAPARTGPSSPAAHPGGASGTATPATPSGATPSGSAGGGGPSAGGGSPPPSPPPPSNPPPPLAQASTSASLGPVTAGAAAGAGSGACSGAAAAVAGSSTGVGCAPPPPTGTGATVSTSGSLAPSKTIHVP